MIGPTSISSNKRVLKWYKKKHKLPTKSLKRLSRKQDSNKFMKLLKVKTNPKKIRLN